MGETRGTDAGWIEPCFDRSRTMPPKNKPGAAKALDPDSLTVPKLKLELKRLGLEQDGLKAALVARLKQGLLGGDAPEQAPKPAAEPEPLPKSKSPAKPAKAQTAKPAKSPAAKPAARGKRGAAAIEPEPKTEPEPTPMETESPVESGKAKTGKGKAATENGGAAKNEEKPSSPAKAPAAKRRKADAPAVAPKPPVVAPSAVPSQDKASRGGGSRLAKVEPDSIAEFAAKHWSGTESIFDESVVQNVYDSELGGGTSPLNLQITQALEMSQYLEKFLWPHFDPTKSSVKHAVSIVAMVNEKFRQGLEAWVFFESDADDEKFDGFFKNVMRLLSRDSGIGGDDKPHNDKLSVVEKTSVVMFLVRAFQSLEHEKVRVCALPLVSLPLWSGLSETRLKLELGKHPGLDKHWRHLQKKQAKALKAAAKEGKPAPVPLKDTTEARWLPRLIDDFLRAARDAVVDGDFDCDRILFCERCLELLIDVLSQLPTRRFVKTVLDAKQVLVKARMTALFAHAHGTLFKQLVDLFSFYLGFEIDDHSGVALSDEDMESKHYDRLLGLQRLCFKHIEKLRNFSLLHCGAVEKREVLTQHLGTLTQLELKRLAVSQLGLVNGNDGAWCDDREFLTEVIVTHFESRPSQKKQINAMPLYPNEDVLFDENVVPSARWVGDKPLALPKLNTQFLTFRDYLLRNFNLFRLEAAYEIREDISDVLTRMAPVKSVTGTSTGQSTPQSTTQTQFKGWSRMALPVAAGALTVTQVKAPLIGETKPSSVRCEVRVNLGSLKGPARVEWDELKQHDVVFLLHAEGGEAGDSSSKGNENTKEKTVAERFGLRRVRGGEVVEVRDGEGTRYNDFGRVGGDGTDGSSGPAGYERTFVLQLDAAQYQLDVDRGDDAMYSSLNVLMRRRPKENNFKSILECIRDLMNADTVVPEWLHDVFLGYGDPNAAQGSNMPQTQRVKTVDFKDTFLDETHLRESFLTHDLIFTNAGAGAGSGSGNKPVPPFRVTFPDDSSDDAEGVGASKNEGNTSSKKQLTVESYSPPDPGPYPEDLPVLNKVRFTPTQVSAVMSGVQPGLTMVVGPPGTGKTDTATQIMHVLYHNEPGQRTLLITHSNAALNDLFTKLMQRDVPARYLLRLGQGERDLDTDLDFSRQGRVDAMLTRRLELLAVVEKLAISLGVPEDVAYTCETASHFWLLHVLARWEKFDAVVGTKRNERGFSEKENGTFVAQAFPFTEFFGDVAGDLFSQSFDADHKKAAGCMRHIRGIFTELAECRAFELLKSPGDRSNYLLTKQAKVIAMTCTHAALKRRDFLKLGLKYDNLVMEESAQVLEIETFIPMMLQQPVDGVSRLKRVVLIGDHHQVRIGVAFPKSVRHAVLSLSWCLFAITTWYRNKTLTRFFFITASSRPW